MPQLVKFLVAFSDNPEHNGVDSVSWPLPARIPGHETATPETAGALAVAYFNSTLRPGEHPRKFVKFVELVDVHPPVYPPPGYEGPEEDPDEGEDD